MTSRVWNFPLELIRDVNYQLTNRGQQLPPALTRAQIRDHHLNAIRARPTTTGQPWNNAVRTWFRKYQTVNGDRAENRDTFIAALTTWANGTRTSQTNPVPLIYELTYLFQDAFDSILEERHLRRFLNDTRTAQYHNQDATIRNRMFTQADGYLGIAIARGDDDDDDE